jgi:branched-chain amino acid transport system permease protein
VLFVAPKLVFTSNLSLTMLSQMGIAIVACLSYNMLLGQGGMLSFGHAVYTGLGSFVAMHALNAVSGGSLPLPVSLMPAGRRPGGHGLRGAAGLRHHQEGRHPVRDDHARHGRAGVRDVADVPGVLRRRGRRVRPTAWSGHPVLGITFGPQIQVYYLIAVYTFLCTAAMFAFTRTPLGRMLNAVRDNPERVEFVGYDTQRVRYLAFIIAGFFAGMAGGMYAMNFEIVTAEVVGAGRSGAYLLFTFLGGATFFFGPIIGAC